MSAHAATGTWRNELGSELRLTVAGNDVRGTYRTGVGRPDASELFPLRGFARGDLVALVVDFGEHGSLTAWTGRLVAGDDGARIVTLWHLVRDRDDGGAPLPHWSSTLAGSSVFRRAEDQG